MDNLRIKLQAPVIKISFYWRGKLFCESLYLYIFLSKILQYTFFITNQMQILIDHGHDVAPIFFPWDFTK